MSDETKPPAQGADAGAVPQHDTSGNGSEGAAHPGVQKRIDELTAQRKATEEQLAAERSEKEKLMMLLMQQNQLPRAPAPEAPKMPTIPAPEGVDPAIWNAFAEQSRIQAAFLAEQQAKALEARLGPALQQLRASQGDMEFQQVTHGLDPAVAADARQRLSYWHQNGLPGTPLDAVKFALGEAAYKNAGAAARRGFNSQMDGNLGGGVPPAALSKPSPQEVPAYADQASDEYNPFKAREYWFKRQRANEQKNGVG